MELLKVANLTKSYGNVLALQQVSFQVRKSEILAYLGPNGAGKTTTINILSGLLKRDSGEVEICGHNLDTDPIAIKRSIGVVPDESNLYPELTCTRNLDYLGELYGLHRTGRRRKIEQLLALFDLEDKARVPFRALSKGLKRRLTIAAALMHAPPLLFLDEPTSGLDVLSARALRRLIVELNRQGTTVLLTTHNMAEAEELADRLIILIRGKIITSGAPDDVRRHASRRKHLEVTFSRKVTEVEIRPYCQKVINVRTLDNGLLLEVTELESTLDDILAFTREVGVRLLSLSSVSPSLEEAFLSLVESYHGVRHQEVP